MAGSVSRTKTPALARVLQRLALFGLFLPLVALTVIVISAVGYWGERSLEDQQQRQAQYMARIVDRYLDQAVRTLNGTARVAEVSSLRESATSLQSTWEAYGYFDTLYYLDARGKITSLAPSDPRYVGLDMSNLSSFQQAELAGSSNISPPFMSLRTGNPTVHLVKRLAHSQIVGELSLKSLQDEITHNGGSANRDTVFIMDQSGMLLAHPSNELVRQRTNPSNLKIFRRGLNKNSTLIYSYQGKTVLGSVVRIDRAGWLVVDQVPLSAIVGPYIWALSLTLVTSLAIWLALTWWLRRLLQLHVVMPLVQLGRGSGALARGDFYRGRALADIPAAFAEVAALAKDFQQMGETLQARQIALQESQDRFLSIIETVQDCLSVFASVRDAAGNIIDFVWRHANAQATVMMGQAPAGLVGARLLELVPSLRDSVLFADYVRVVESEQPVRYVAKIDDPSWRGTFEGWAAKLGDGFVVTYRDVTASRQVAEAVAASEQRLRAAINSLLDPCVLLESIRDDSGTIVDFRCAHSNHAACRNDGMSREELTGRRMLDLLSGRAESGLRRMYAAVVESGEPLVLDGFTYRYELRDGEPRQYDVRAARVGDGVCSTWRDVTDRHAAELALRESENRFRSVVAALGEGVLVQNRDGQIIECNTVAERILGLRRSVLLGLTWDDERLAALHEDGTQFPPESQPAAICLRSGESCRDVTMGLLREGKTAGWILINAVPLLRSGQSAPYAVVTSFTDITELRRAGQELEDSEERFRLAFDDALAGMALVDVEPASAGQFLRVNHVLCEYLGREKDQLLGRDMVDVVPAEDVDLTRISFAELVAGKVTSYRAERRFVHAGGSLLWGLLSLALVRGRGGRPLYALAQIEDVTARKQAEADLVFRALHDDLTGLPNRVLLSDRIAGALARAKRTGARIGVLFVDLDNFKAINDSYGHLAGDEFLKQVAERISRSLRGGDTSARIGGDEFVVLCDSLADMADAGAVAQRIQDALTAEIPVQGLLLSASASIGISISDDSSTPGTLLRDADSAMYVAKRRGGRRWEPANESLHAAAMRVVTLGSELRRALTNGQLCVHYQPIYDLETQRPVAAEALVRWQHPEQGLLLPGAFLDVAEQCGLVVDLGAVVLQKACAQAARWRQQFGPRAPVVAVNIASPQIGKNSLSRLVEDVLEATSLPAQQLCLEIIESQLVGVGTCVVTDLRRVSDLGVRIAVDDFGRGFAGLEYLRHLPAHELKVDASFVAGLNIDPTDTAITTSVIALGRSLGLTVVAEGIERSEQLEALRSLGCSWGQGWLWSQAGPAAEVDQILQRYASSGPETGENRGRTPVQ